jgi:serine protease
MKKWTASLTKLAVSLALFLPLAACNTTPTPPDPAETELTVVTATPERNQSADKVEISKNEVIVKFKEGVSALQIGESLTVDSTKLTMTDTLSGDEAFLEFVTADGIDATAATLSLVASLQKRSDVEYAQPNYIDQPMRTPNDTYFRLQWHYNNIQLPQAWDTITGGGPVVAVLDTGSTNHPDLRGRWIGGYDFISDRTTAKDGNGRDNNPTDPGDGGSCNGMSYGSSWHGTHVAGTIGATGNDRYGVTGVN